MKKIAILAIFSLLIINNLSAQKINNGKYKIVFQLTNNDTLVHKAMVKQIFNALTAAPNTKIEVVCHNNGINFLQSAKTIMGGKIKELKEKGVVFAACENTLKERNIAKTDIVSEAIFVPAGIIEVADKQQKGFAYIKAGF